MLVQLSRGQTAGAVVGAFADAVVTLPVQLCRSLTWNQAKEIAEHVESNGLLRRKYFSRRNRLQDPYAE